MGTGGVDGSASIARALRAAAALGSGMLANTELGRRQDGTNTSIRVAKSVSFSGVGSLPDSAQLNSRYNLRRRRRGAEAPVAPVKARSSRTLWKKHTWVEGNSRQSAARAWRVERRELKLRPLASQPPDANSSVAMRSDPLFSTRARAKIATLSNELGTSESFSVQLVRPSGPDSFANATALPSPPHGQERAVALRFVDAVAQIKAQLGLPSHFTPEETVRRGCESCSCSSEPCHTTRPQNVPALQHHLHFAAAQLTSPYFYCRR